MAEERQNLGTAERLKIGEGTKPSPDVLEVVYLDEIAGRLVDLNTNLADMSSVFASKLASLGEKVDNINTFLEDTSYEGRTKTVKKTITGDDRNVKIPINEKWYENTIFNDGPDDVYVESSQKSRGDTSINMGDQINVKSKRGSTKPVYIRCDPSDTAAVRVVYKM